MSLQRSELVGAMRRGHAWIAQVHAAPDDQGTLVWKALVSALIDLVLANDASEERAFKQADIESLDASGPDGVSDLILTLAVCAAARRFGLEQGRLKTLAELTAASLWRTPAPLPADMALATSMLRSCGVDIPDCGREEMALPPLAQIVEAARPTSLRLCKTVANVTAWGQLDAGFKPQLAHLPALTTAWAREWDIEMTGALLRTCSYLKLSGDTACEWSVKWLLDQQQDDGRFGLLASEAKQLGRDPDDWQMYFGPTTSAIWTLAELCRPGLVLAA